MQTENKQTAKLSIVIPVYNSAEIFPELHKRLTSTMAHYVDTMEIIAVLDGCRDNSFDVISALAKSDERIKLIELSRNFGHQAAITAGLEFASGEVIVVMDDDLEDPPEVLPEFIGKLNEGFDVVYGIRKVRKRSFLHRMVYASFYRVFGLLANIKMPYDAGDFCVMRKKVVKALGEMPETNRFLRGLRAWSGFRQTGIEYARGGRFAGESGYSLRQYFRLALNGIFSFSYQPINYISIMGFLIAIISFLLGFGFIVLKMSGLIPDVPGWTSLAVLIAFLSGIQLLSAGIIGAYISRIYDEVKRRPKYLINRVVGVKEDGRYAGD